MDNKCLYHTDLSTGIYIFPYAKLSHWDKGEKEPTGLVACFSATWKKQITCRDKNIFKDTTKRFYEFQVHFGKTTTVVKFTLGKWLHKVHTRTKTKTDFVFTLPGDTNVSCMFTKTETDKYYLSGIRMYHCRIHQTCTEWYILSILSRNPVSKIFLNENFFFLSFFSCFCFYFALKILRHFQQTCDLLSETNVKFLIACLISLAGTHQYMFMYLC